MEPHGKMMSLAAHAQQVSTYLEEGKVDEAVELARRAVAELEDLGSQHDEGDIEALMLIGRLLSETKQLREAKRAFDRVLMLADATNLSDEEILATLYNNLGQVEHALGNRVLAKELLEKAVKIGEAQSPEGIVTGINLDNLGAIYFDLAELEMAKSAHKRAISIFQSSCEPMNRHLATAIGNLSTVFESEGDYSTALTYRLRALDMHMRCNGLYDPETINDLAVLATIHFRHGDLGGADEWICELLKPDFGLKRESLYTLADRLLLVAKSAFDEFHLGIAVRLCNRSVELLEKLDGPNGEKNLDAQNLLGTVLLAKSDKASAKAILHRTIDGYRTAGLNKKAIDSTISLAKIYRDSGEFVLAKTLLESVIKELQELPKKDGPQIASALGNLSGLYFKMGDYEQAQKVLNEAICNCRDSVERPWLLHDRGMLAYHLGQYDDACKDYEEAKQLWIGIHSEEHPFVATTLANLALVYWAQDKIDNAIECFEQSAMLKQRQARRILAVGSEKQRASYSRELEFDLDKVISFYFEAGANRPKVASFAAECLLSCKGRVLDAITQTVTSIRAGADDEGRVSIQRLHGVRQKITELMTPTLKRGRAPRDLNELRRLRVEEEKLETDLSYRSTLLASELSEVRLKAVCERIPEDAALIEFVRYRPFERGRSGNWDTWRKPRYAALVLRREHEPSWYDIEDAAIVDEYLTSWLKLLKNRLTKKTDREEGTRKLFSILFAPIKDSIKDSSHILVTPDHLIGLAPLSLLFDAASSDWSTPLISYLTSSRELLEQDDASECHGIVVFADPDFSADIDRLSGSATGPLTNRGGFSPLPGTRSESEKIVELFDDVTELLDEEATVDALYGLCSPTVLHIATHGLFEPMEHTERKSSFDLLQLNDELLFVTGTSDEAFVHPMFFSGLALAGANKSGDGSTPGIITAQQIAGINLSGTQLVVLSACETGVGRAGFGEELAGLRRAIAIAGAASQVTSLWKVDDEATAALMSHFYRFLSSGQGRIEALKHAQQAIQTDPNHPEWEHPFYWATFVLSGAWSAMNEYLVTRSV